MYHIHNQSGSKNFRKQLRENQTKTELLLWYRLRKSQLGVKFRRQHGIGPYIADFYCAEVGLVVEVDGSVHFDDSEKEMKDAEREGYFKSLGMSVIRFTNDKVERDLEGVVISIKDVCEKMMVE